MRTVNRDAIVEFDSHVKRLCTSLSLMKFGGANNETESPKATTLMASFRNIEKLKQKLVPMLAKGLQTFHDEIDPTSSSDHPWETKVSVMIAYSAEVNYPFRRVIRNRLNDDNEMLERSTVLRRPLFSVSSSHLPQSQS